jgi:predicted HicB family RNase H-like nuclease
MNTLHHQGNEGVIAFDEEAEVFHGEVFNLHDVITFQGASVSELQDSFTASVEDYLAFYAATGATGEFEQTGDDEACGGDWVMALLFRPKEIKKST